MKYDIFISFSKSDFEEVNNIKKSIAARLPELKIRFDINDTRGGDDTEDEIISAIDNSKSLLFAVSDESLNTKLCKSEVMYAKNTGKRVIPVLLKNSALKGWLLFKFGKINCYESWNP